MQFHYCRLQRPDLPRPTSLYLFLNSFTAVWSDSNIPHRQHTQILLFPAYALMEQAHLLRRICFEAGPDHGMWVCRSWVCGRYPLLCRKWAVSTRAAGYYRGNLNLSRQHTMMRLASCHHLVGVCPIPKPIPPCDRSKEAADRAQVLYLLSQTAQVTSVACI